MPESTAHDRFTRMFDKKDGFLARHNVERPVEIELAALATIAGVDPLFLGERGVGKTWLIELLCKYGFADDVRLFTHLLAKDQSSDEVLGPRSLKAMEEDRIARMMDGYLPTAHYSYLDEIFKASPTMLNPLLDIFANRTYKMGGVVVDCGQLIAVFASSNELPDREDLEPFRDRIAITRKVEPVATPEGRRRVTDIQLDFQSNGIDTDGLEPLTLADIASIRLEAKQVIVPDAIRDVMGEMQQKWLEANHAPSQRRIGQMWKVVKAHAWLSGRNEATADDLVPVQHMAFNRMEDAASARKVVMEFASAFTRKTDTLRDAMEPKLKQMDELREALVATADKTQRRELLKGGFDHVRDLKELHEDGVKLRANGEKTGHDTTDLDELLHNVDQAVEWGNKLIISGGQGVEP